MPALAQQRLKSDAKQSEFLQDVLLGLQQSPPTLPCKYFYDDAGSALFEQICNLDEYYVTRAEIALLERSRAAIAQHLAPSTTVIEPGAGAGVKAAILLDAMPSPQAFVPLEISASALEGATDSLQRRFPDLDIHPLEGDFTADPQDIRAALPDAEHILIFFPGSTIGNFCAEEAVEVLGNLATLAGDGGQVLVGADLIKDRQRLINAYDDQAGVTAQFNKNILRRINRELGGNFDDSGFAHRAVYNESLDRIEMHLVAQGDQRVSVAGEHFQFADGTFIHTENSHKYSEASFSELAGKAGLRVTQRWRSPDVALYLLTPEQ